LVANHDLSHAGGVNAVVVEAVHSTCIHELCGVSWQKRWLTTKPSS